MSTWTKKEMETLNYKVEDVQNLSLTFHRKAANIQNMKEQYVIEWTLDSEKSWQSQQTFDASENRTQQDMDNMMDQMQNLKRIYPYYDFRLVYRQEQILGSTL